MSGQYDFGVIDPAAKSGSGLAADLNKWRTALHSLHRGLTRPAYATAGMMWIKEVSPTTWEIYLFTGTADILYGTANPTFNTFLPGIPAGGLPASMVAGGPGSGLNGDLLDGLHATSFLRADADSVIAQGKNLKFAHSPALNSDDGKIAAGLFAAGLNIVGVASTGNGVRYVTSFGDWTNYGSFTATTSISATGAIISTTRVEAQATYPRFLWHRPGGYAWNAYLEPSNNYIYMVAGTDGSGNGGAGVQAFSTDGSFWTASYGWLHDRFAYRTPVGGMGGARVEGNCGEFAAASGYEIFDVGNGQHQVRAWVTNCYNCNCACACLCDCDGGG